MSNIAEIGGANVERKIGKASVRDAIIGTGDTPSEAEREERRALHDKPDEIARRLADAQTPSE